MQATPTKECITLIIIMFSKKEIFRRGLRFINMSQTNDSHPCVHDLSPCRNRRLAVAFVFRNLLQPQEKSTPFRPSLVCSRAGIVWCVFGRPRGRFSKPRHRELFVLTPIPYALNICFGKRVSRIEVVSSTCGRPGATRILLDLAPLYYHTHCIQCRLGIVIVTR